MCKKKGALSIVLIHCNYLIQNSSSDLPVKISYPFKTKIVWQNAYNEKDSSKSPGAKNFS